MSLFYFYYFNILLLSYHYFISITIIIQITFIALDQSQDHLTFSNLSDGNQQITQEEGEKRMLNNTRRGVAMKTHYVLP